MLSIATMHSFACVIKKSPFFSCLFKKTPPAHFAWYFNKKLLSALPASSSEDKELLHFLQKQWLAKATGCYPFLIDWMCPAFGISHQVHPESTNSYARDPAAKISKTYLNQIQAWKKQLPHPQDFPLILTRPSNILEHFHLKIEMRQGETIPNIIERLSSIMNATTSSAIVDLTAYLPLDTMDPRQWLKAWRTFENQFLQYSKEHRLDINRILCIQRLRQKDIGGIRLLAFSSVSKEIVDSQHQFLIEKISRFGLSANRIELYRPIEIPNVSSEKKALSLSTKENESIEQFVSFLNDKEQSWRSKHVQKTLLFQATAQILKDLCRAIPQTKWEEIMHSPTRFAAVQLCLNKIKQQLDLIIQEGDGFSFHDTVSHIELIHADIASLLEIFSPFSLGDFIDAFRCHLTCIPQELKPLTGYGLHASGMTSLAGIYKAAEKMLGKPPRILYGENTYFECILSAEHIVVPKSITEASEEDWEQVDLILAQFNPVLKRINFQVTEYQATEYHIEDIALVLHRALKNREGRPLSLALDGTLDYSNSMRVKDLLLVFQKEIETGALNVSCYRSGIKFDLFGMDNYCGGPFFAIHNQDEKWSDFDALLTDPALLTDRLSLNWFALAFQNAAPYLESYRKQIFDNTHAVLNKIPKRLFSKEPLKYRVIPMDSDTDPAFIDIKIFGPLHPIRGSVLVGGLLTLKCMQAGFPLFYRPSIGFNHPNLTVLFGKGCTTVRLTIGLDPAQVDVIVDCMKTIDALNGKSEDLQSEKIWTSNSASILHRKNRTHPEIQRSLL